MDKETSGTTGRKLRMGGPVPDERLVGQYLVYENSQHDLKNVNWHALLLVY